MIFPRTCAESANNVPIERKRAVSGDPIFRSLGEVFDSDSRIESEDALRLNGDPGGDAYAVQIDS